MFITNKKLIIYQQKVLTNKELSSNITVYFMKGEKHELLTKPSTNRHYWNHYFSSHYDWTR